MCGLGAFGGWMKILGLTLFRPELMARPLGALEDSRVVVLDPGRGFLGRLYECVVRCTAAVRGYGPDVIYVDSYYTRGLVAVLLGWVYGVPVVFRIHDDVWRIHRERLERLWGEGRYLGWLKYSAGVLMSKAALRGADGYVAVSSELRDAVLENTGVSEDRVEVVRLPLRGEFDGGDAVEARRRHGVEEESVVLTVTNLKYRSKYEGVRCVLDALEPVLERGDVGYVVAGDGRYLEELRGDVDDLSSGARDSVYLPGFVDGVEDLYAAADVFVYVSYVDGYPNVVLEAMHAGLPVVANPAHGMVDQMQDGETGFLVESGEELRRRVEELLEDEELRGRLGRGAREVVMRRNSADAVAEELEEAVSRMCGRAA